MVLEPDVDRQQLIAGAQRRDLGDTNVTERAEERGVAVTTIRAARPNGAWSSTMRTGTESAMAPFSPVRRRHPRVPPPSPVVRSAPR